MKNGEAKEHLRYSIGFLYILFLWVICIQDCIESKTHFYNCIIYWQHITSTTRPVWKYGTRCRAWGKSTISTLFVLFRGVPFLAFVWKYFCTCFYAGGIGYVHAPWPPDTSTLSWIVKDLFCNGPKDVRSGHPFTQSRQELEERVLTITVGKL